MGLDLYDQCPLIGFDHKETFYVTQSRITTSHILYVSQYGRVLVL